MKSADPQAAVNGIIRAGLFHTIDRMLVISSLEGDWPGASVSVTVSCRLRFIVLSLCGGPCGVREARNCIARPLYRCQHEGADKALVKRCGAATKESNNRVSSVLGHRSISYPDGR